MQISNLGTFQKFWAQFSSRFGKKESYDTKRFQQSFSSNRGLSYGQSPDGMMATFQRPKCVTSIANLFLVGGGVHPGAGVPMATLSALSR